MTISKNHSILSQEEELECISKYETCSKSYDRLMLSHLKLVISIAKKFTGYGLPLEDLIQEGNIGLIKAIKRFDASKGFRLNTYASIYIKSEMLNFIINNYKIIKITTNKAQRKLFFNFKTLKQESVEVGINPEQLKIIAEKLNVPLHEVIDMEQRLSHNYVDISNEDGEEWVEGNNLLDTLIEEHQYISRLSWLNDSLKQFDDRTNDIIRSRHMQEKPETFENLANKYNVSFQRVQQIEKVTLDKLKDQAKTAQYC